MNPEDPVWNPDIQSTYSAVEIQLPRSHGAMPIQHVGVSLLFFRQCLLDTIGLVVPEHSL